LDPVRELTIYSPNNDCLEKYKKGKKGPVKKIFDAQYFLVVVQCFLLVVQLFLVVVGSRVRVQELGSGKLF
jgi:hypothetical protein